MKKILFTATVQSHICQFHLPIMQMLKEQGNEVHVAANNNLQEKNGLQIKFADKIFIITFSRSPMSRKNITAYKKLKNIIDKENYDIIHCNTPMGGVITRLAARNSRKKGTRVIYTAHGFHFYKGAPLINWIIYYPIERFMARFTDDLITINREDYIFAKKKKFKTVVHHVKGVGVNSNKYKKLKQEDILKLRQAKGYCMDDKIILCIGELNENKNQTTVIKAMSRILKKYTNAKLLLAGNGPSEKKLKQLAVSENVSNNIEFLGYRTDLQDYVNLCDIAVSASIREGLPLNVMESMICGKPIVASINRGHKELVIDGQTGYLVEPKDDKSFAEKIIELICDNNKAMTYGESGLQSIEPFDIVNVKEQLSKIYG
jgi:glycosyltransferase EpsD